jgi:hypothetical protein
MKNVYTAEEEEFTPPNRATECRVHVLCNGERVGSYERNYSLLDTFFPFELNGKELALYSPDYTATRVLSLPDCTDLGGEEPDGGGFCPVEFYVPRYLVYEQRAMYQGEEHAFRRECNEPADFRESDDRRIVQPETFRPFGFVSGCVWGDDTSWKIQYLDLTQADHGKIVREERFGHVELLANLTLRETVDMRHYRADYPVIELAVREVWNLEKGRIQ